MTTSVFRSHGCLCGSLHPDALRSCSLPPPPPPPARPHWNKLPASSSTRPMKPGRSFPDRWVPPRPRPHHRRKSSSPATKSGGGAGNQARRALVMEEVKILKRGEDLKSASSPPVDATLIADESVLCQTFPFGPEPDNLPRKLGFVDLDLVYSGSGFVISPSPSSLPLPSSFIKKAPMLTR
ncbi:hypothetical protein Cni_G28196 [Canna indica]|uniref:Uncharacterized protein n=1 Tax=Canna indica TaxID=4628 RepID=A0AAQ3L275_9LILI|nr:hypothetical protein Cni_G28196 [Canna indica]